MAIKPIIFNTEMVQATLRGQKTCTRIIMKPQLTAHYGTQYVKPPCAKGDILYVRETWTRFECWNCDGDEEGNCVKEPHISVLEKQCGCYLYRATSEIGGDAKWHPSIHMPKEAARIWLKVTDVKVERLQNIDGKGCVKEGIEEEPLKHVGEDFVKGMFHDLWDSTINKSDIDRYGWGANPWVWVIEFERCKKPEEDKRCD